MLSVVLLIALGVVVGSKLEKILDAVTDKVVVKVKELLA